jgi:cytochrome c-type biogenesis protein CcmH
VASFWIIAAVFIVAALMFVLPPLLGRSTATGPTRKAISRALHQQRLAELERDARDGLLTRAQYESARLDLERDFLADFDDHAGAAKPSPTGKPWLAWLVPIVLPAVAIGLYVQFSTGLSLFNGEQQTVATAAGARDQLTAEDMAEIIEKRLQDNPQDRTGWIMLARVYTLLGHYADASHAYERADDLASISEPQLLAAYAQTLAFANGQQFAGRPTGLLNQALEVDPDNVQALWLAGWAALQREDFTQAVGYWKQLEAVVPADQQEELFENLPEQIAKVERLAQQPSPVSNADAEAPNSASILAPGEEANNSEGAAPAAVNVRVRLAPELADRVSSQDTLFVYAQATDGARMPLALTRHTAAELPISVTLDDRSAMTPAFKLSSKDTVRIKARISKTGDAMPNRGDLLGQSPPVVTRGGGLVSITIDEVVP